MILPSDPRRLAVDLLPRSRCAVQVAAVIADSFGIFSWGGGLTEGRFCVIMGSGGYVNDHRIRDCLGSRTF